MDEIINEFLKDQEKIEKNIEEFLKMGIEIEDIDVTLEDVNIEILEDLELDINN